MSKQNVAIGKPPLQTQPDKALKPTQVQDTAHKRAQSARENADFDSKVSQLKSKLEKYKFERESLQRTC